MPLLTLSVNDGLLSPDDAGSTTVPAGAAVGDRVVLAASVASGSQTVTLTSSGPTQPVKISGPDRHANNNLSVYVWDLPLRAAGDLGATVTVDIDGTATSYLLGSGVVLPGTDLDRPLVIAVDAGQGGGTAPEATCPTIDMSEAPGAVAMIWAARTTSATPLWIAAPAGHEMDVLTNTHRTASPNFALMVSHNPSPGGAGPKGDKSTTLGSIPTSVVTYTVGAFKAPVVVPPEPEPTTVFGFNISSLGSDGNLSEQSKVDDHKALLGADSAQNVRVFLGGTTLGAGIWNNPRIQALGEDDSLLLSTNTRVSLNRAGMAAMLAATPERFTKRPGQVKFAVRHEFEAEWADAGPAGSTARSTWLTNWLNDNAAAAAELDASPFETQSRDDLVKIFLWYSQHVDSRTKDTMGMFHGGQDYGMIGMDCYNYAVWLNQQDRYATPAELLDKLINFGLEVGLPVCVPEWGGEAAATDTNYARRAQAITAQGEYMKEHKVVFANWWCAVGSLDPQGQPRQHHLEAAQSNVDAYKAL